MEAVAGIIIAILAALFGIERTRRRNADRRADEAEAGKHIAEAEKRAAASGAAVLTETAERIGEIDAEKKTYSEAVEDFNRGRDHSGPSSFSLHDSP